MDTVPICKLFCETGLTNVCLSLSVLDTGLSSVNIFLPSEFYRCRQSVCLPIKRQNRRLSACLLSVLDTEVTAAHINFLLLSDFYS